MNACTVCEAPTEHLYCSPKCKWMAARDREKAKRSLSWIERLELVRARGLEPVLIAVAAQWYVVPRHILGNRRHRTTVLARHDFCRKLHAEPYNLSSPEIGELVGLEHTSVLSAVGALAKKRSA